MTRSPLTKVLAIGLAAAAIAAVWTLWTQDTPSDLWRRILLSAVLLALPAFFLRVENLRSRAGQSSIRRDDSAGGD
jgi:hypothetical protein